jgi:hypothetical protein
VLSSESLYINAPETDETYESDEMPSVSWLHDVFWQRRISSRVSHVNYRALKSRHTDYTFAKGACPIFS